MTARSVAIVWSMVLHLSRMVRSTVLELVQALCVMLANLPRGKRRGWTRYHSWDLLRAHRVAARLRNGDAVLDIGCGTGHVLAELAMFREIRPQGVDIALHPRRIPEIPIRAFDGRRLEFGDKQFDVTLLCYVLHHLTPTEAAALFDEAVRVTRRKVLLLEDSLPRFGWFYRMRNLLHRVEAGARYEDSAKTYSMPRDEAMFLTHDEWRSWLAKQPGVTEVVVHSLADIMQYDHHTLLDITLTR